MFTLSPPPARTGLAGSETEVAILRPRGSWTSFVARDPLLKWLLQLSRAVSTSALNLTTLIPFPR